MALIDARELESFAAAVVRAFGSPPEVAEPVAESLVGADLVGHGSHGVRRLATLYDGMIDRGELDPAATPTVDRDGPTAASVDGHQGWGQFTGRYAADLAIEKARESGVACVGVGNGAHLGRIGEFAERAAGAGLVLLALANTGGAGDMAAIPGTTERNISVNPYAIGVPTFDALPFPIVFDAATGQVAHGKIMKRALAGEPLPEEWAIDGEGGTLTDAVAFEDGAGAILPHGGEQFGYKGAGLALVLELIAGTVGGTAVHGMDAPYRVNNGAAMVAIDPERFLDRGACRERVEALAGYLRSLEYDPDLVPEPAERGDHPPLPGEPEHRLRREREEEGVPLEAGAIENLVAVADEHGVEERPAGF